MKKILVSLILCALANLSLIAQDHKWGILTEEEKDLEYVSYDSTASAVVLFDKVKANFTHGAPSSFTYHKRIKILKPEAIKEADVIIRSYYFNKMETISILKAHSFNPDGENYMLQEIDNDNIFEVKDSERRKSLRISFPGIKVGSIIEYKYTRYSKLTSTILQWYFQGKYPTLYSSCKTKVKSDLDIRTLTQGKRLSSKYKGKKTKDWVLTDLPAIKDEKYCPNERAYAEQISFQLGGFISGGEYINISGNWNDFIDDYYQDFEVSTYNWKRNKTINKIYKDNFASIKGGQEKLIAIKKWITQNIKWNKYYSLRPRLKLNQLLASKEGSTSEINLLLSALLSKAGFNNTLVMNCTSRYGKISKQLPITRQFNNVLVYVQTSKGGFLMDASNPYYKYNEVPFEMMNFNALVAQKRKPMWLNLAPNKGATQSAKVYYNFNEEKSTIRFSCTLDGYRAAELRNKFNKPEKKEKELFRSFIKDDENDLKLISSKVENWDKIGKPIILTAEYEYMENPIGSIDKMYLTPMEFHLFSRKPFTVKEREFPVIFNYPIENSTDVTISLPKGYEFIESPKTFGFKTTDGKTKYNLFVGGNKSLLSFRSRVSIDKHFYTPDEYSELKQFFQKYLNTKDKTVIYQKEELNKSK